MVTKSPFGNQPKTFPFSSFFQKKSVNWIYSCNSNLEFFGIIPFTECFEGFQRLSDFLNLLVEDVTDVSLDILLSHHLIKSYHCEALLVSCRGLLSRCLWLTAWEVPSFLAFGPACSDTWLASQSQTRWRTMDCWPPSHLFPAHRGRSLENAVMKKTQSIAGWEKKKKWAKPNFCEILAYISSYFVFLHLQHQFRL